MIINHTNNIGFAFTEAITTVNAVWVVIVTVNAVWVVIITVNAVWVVIITVDVINNDNWINHLKNQCDNNRSHYSNNGTNNDKRGGYNNIKNNINDSDDTYKWHIFRKMRNTGTEIK